FALHAELPQRLGDDWGYRRLATYGGFTGSRSRARGSIGWLSDRVTVSQTLGSPETTAQVHPAGFTMAMMRAAEAQGAERRPGRVIGLATKGDASPVSKSTARRSPATPSSSRWARGRYWRRPGCLC